MPFINYLQANLIREEAFAKIVLIYGCQVLTNRVIALTFPYPLAGLASELNVRERDQLKPLRYLYNSLSVERIIVVVESKVIRNASIDFMNAYRLREAGVLS